MASFPFIFDAKADLIYHLKRGPVVVSEAALLASFGYIWGVDLCMIAKQAVQSKRVGKHSVRLEIVPITAI